MHEMVERVVSMSFEGIVNSLNEMTPEMCVGVVAHTRPDGDAVGSVLAMVAALRDAGIQALPLMGDEEKSPRVYSWLAHFDEYLMPSQVRDMTFDYLIVLDTPTIKRLNEGHAYLAQARSVLLIDHHVRQDIPASECFVDTSASATAQLVWRVIAASRFQRTLDVAKGCLVGLVTDTGSFQHSNTDAQALIDAADMVAMGANPSNIATHVFNSKTPAALELEACVLNRLRVANDGRVAYSYMRDEDYESLGAEKSEGENLVDIVRSVEGIQVGVLFTVSESSTRISLRAKDDTDVSRVAQAIGGGGHKAAAGCTWPDDDASLDTVIAGVLALLPGGKEAQ